MSNTDVEYIEPHPGPQTAFCASPADIAIYGGQAGGGKSWALLATAAAFTDIPSYGAVIFRRESPQITNEGGLWDESMSIYPLIGGTAKQHTLDWRFDSGANIGFRHLQHEKDTKSWQGAQVAMIGFDELTHFTESQFWYLLSRNRSTCGVRPFVRATTNPLPDDDPVGGWVCRLIYWWIDHETGFAIPERSGIIRWFIRRNGELCWADTKQELIERFTRHDLPEGHKKKYPKPKSLTFIPAKLEDNPSMEEADPDYRANLEAMPEVDRQRLLEGNWNARLQAGMFFKVGMIKIVDALPVDLRYCRGWDLAATDGAGDWTVGGKLGKDASGFFYIADIRRGQWEANYRDNVICQTAETDGRCIQRIPEDPAAAGKSEAARMVRMLAGHNIKKVNVRGDKQLRATGMASQINAGNVFMLRADWNAGLLQRLDSFPTKGVPDDEIDALSDAFNELCTKKKLIVGLSDKTTNTGGLSNPTPDKYAAITVDAEGKPKKKLMVGI